MGVLDLVVLLACSLRRCKASIHLMLLQLLMRVEVAIIHHVLLLDVRSETLDVLSRIPVLSNTI